MSYKYWLKNVSFVIICLFILFQILLSFKPYLGTNKTEEYVYYKRDWIRSNIGEKVKNKENIVVLGDSTITSGFLPNIFDNESSFTNTINLSIVDSDAQKHIVNNTFEYPIIDGVEPNQLIAQFGLSFKQDLKTKVSSYYKKQAEALKIMTEAGWN